MNRRKFMAMMMAGAVVTAEGIWMPGQKLISIPSGQVFGNEYDINSMFRLIDHNTVEYIGAQDKVVSITQFYDWLKKHAAYMMHDFVAEDSLVVSLEPKYRMMNPEYLTGGSLAQDAPDDHCAPGLREMWSSDVGLGECDLHTDKIYYTESSEPRTRISTLDNGYRGHR